MSTGRHDARVRRRDFDTDGRVDLPIVICPRGCSNTSLRSMRAVRRHRATTTPMALDLDQRINESTVSAMAPAGPNVYHGRAIFLLRGSHEAVRHQSLRSYRLPVQLRADLRLLRVRLARAVLGCDPPRLRGQGAGRGRHRVAHGRRRLQDTVRAAARPALDAGRALPR